MKENELENSVSVASETSKALITTPKTATPKSIGNRFTKKFNRNKS
jgi:hypothetical protein